MRLEELGRRLREASRELHRDFAALPLVNPQARTDLRQLLD